MMQRKWERIIVGACVAVGLVWAISTTDFRAFEFKLDYLISLSSLLTVASFSVKGMLPLRILAVASQITAIPYFMLQPTPLWTPVGWTILFLAINLYHITRILLERRPVKFTADEQRLYELAFATFQPRKFLKLLTLGEWKSAGKGDRLLVQGDPITHIAVPIAGAVTARQKQGKVAHLEPGEVIGAGMALTGQPAFIDAEFAEDAHCMSWRVADVNRFMAKNPNLAIKFNGIVSRYLVGQINKLALNVGSK